MSAQGGGGLHVVSSELRWDPAHGDDITGQTSCRFKQRLLNVPAAERLFRETAALSL